MRRAAVFAALERTAIDIHIGSVIGIVKNRAV